MEQLALGGWQVTAVYRKGSKNATLSMLAERYKPLITVLHADVLDRASLEATMPEGVGAVFHVAAALGFWYGARDLNYRTNVLGRFAAWTTKETEGCDFVKFSLFVGGASD